MDEFPHSQTVDYHDTQKGQALSPSLSGKELVLYKKDIHRPENLQKRLAEIIKDVVLKEVAELMNLVTVEMGKDQKAENDSRTTKVEETSESTKKDGKFMIVAEEQVQAHPRNPKVKDPEKKTFESMKEDSTHMVVAVEQAPVGHESSKIKDSELSINTRPAQSASKAVAHISNISFKIPDDFENDDDIINEFEPEDEVIREITVENRKNFSFSDRLHGWKMECKIRLSGVQQFDKYFTHIKSKTVTRSVPEVVRFILYEVNPKQIREANRKRKSIYMSEPPKSRCRCTLQKTFESPRNVLKAKGINMSSNGTTSDLDQKEESYVEMFLRVAWRNQMNGTAEEVPPVTEWEALNTMKKKARIITCEQEVESPNMDGEATNHMMRQAKNDFLVMKRRKSF